MSKQWARTVLALSVVLGTLAAHAATGGIGQVLTDGTRVQVNGVVIGESATLPAWGFVSTAQDGARVLLHSGQEIFLAPQTRVRFEITSGGQIGVRVKAGRLELPSASGEPLQAGTHSYFELPADRRLSASPRPVPSPDEATGATPTSPPARRFSDD